MPIPRRDFLKLGAAVAASAVPPPSAVAQTVPSPGGFFAAPPIPLVRIGFVGVGLQGGGL